MKALLLGLAALATAALTIPASAHCFDGHVTAETDTSAGSGNTDAPPPPAES